MSAKVHNIFENRKRMREINVSFKNISTKAVTVTVTDRNSATYLRGKKVKEKIYIYIYINIKI